MDRVALEQFQNKLKFHRDALMAWYQNEVPRNNGAMGHEELEEFHKVIAAHDDALRRIENGTFGRCVQCKDNGEVEAERLALDFTTCVCLSHYSKEQIHALENDLELAAKVHRQLMPTAVPSLPNIQIAAFTESARIVGGDYFDFYPDRAGRQGMILADVMGKGLPASMLVPNLQASLRILGPEYDEPHAIATRLNELFRYNLKLIRFISIFLASIDPSNRLLRYCNAGHNAPLVWDASRTEILQLHPTGPAIGLTHAPIFNTSELLLSEGDLVLLYTDGLIEGQNSRGDEFGEEKLASYLRQHAVQPAKVFLDELVEVFKRFVGGPIQDDITMIVLKFD
jgi:sigma-B regulation protein RsbU (phosphoserine phosphatase)